MSDKEIWKDIPDYEGLYQISNFGRVKSCDRFEYIANPHGTFTLRKRRGQILAFLPDTKGYHRVGLWKDNIRRNAFVHRLVATSFIKNTENKPEVNHLDRDKVNNHVSNLEWATRIENERHKYTVGEPCRNVGPTNNNGRPVINTYTGKIYETVRQASTELGMGYDYLQSMLRGVRPNRSQLKYVDQ